MSKNEIHARVPPQLMESLKAICAERKCNLSDITRAALVLYVDACQKTNPCGKIIQLIRTEQSLEIGFISANATCATADLLDELDESTDNATSPVNSLEDEEFIEW